MPDGLLTARKRTLGSHTVLLHSRRLKLRSTVQPRAYLAIASPSWVERLDAIPIQSSADSPLFQSLDTYLGSVLADFGHLVSDATKQMRLISSAEARAANMDPWEIKNGRRIRLIEKKHREGLSAPESVELERLKREVYDHIQAIAPRSTEVLDEIDVRIENLKRKAVAKRGEKA